MYNEHERFGKGCSNSNQSTDASKKLVKTWLGEVKNESKVLYVVT